MKILLKSLLVLLIVIALSACNTIQEYWTEDEPKQLSPNTYKVNKGDTLYSIAWLYELDYRQLAQWNNIKAPNYLIYPNQQLRLSAPRTATAAPKAVPRKAVSSSGWRWPLTKPEVEALPRSNAVLMKGKQAEAVRAVSDGVVVYSGFNLKHYHGLIIIKHTEDVFSVYGNNKEILVAEKEHVVAGQEIARLSDAPDDTKLYFEVRQGGRPLKALNYLPKLKISNR